jgi:hypothetical protein
MTVVLSHKRTNGLHCKVPIIQGQEVIFITTTKATLIATTKQILKKGNTRFEEMHHNIKRAIFSIIWLASYNVPNYMGQQRANQAMY